jgi:alpha-glucosidase
MSTLAWWQRGVIYQLLVQSYQDTNGDGTGDLQGVIDRLGYLRDLGVAAIWLSPISPSTNADLGYDVTDYRNVDPKFGSLDDFDRLLHEAHSRDIKVLLDWVPNHTSDEHPWFQASRSDRNHPQRDWYLWRDAKPDGSPPNNWISVFGGSVWEWDEHTGQYYLHTFLTKQPDLNWRHPDVRAAMYDAMRFWLQRGVDGFRIDALDLMIKDEQFRDNPPNPAFDPERAGPDDALLPDFTRDQPEVHHVVAEMRQIVDEFGPGRVMLGELYLPLEKTMTYYGRERPELHLPLNMRFAWTDWSTEKIGEMIGQCRQLLNFGEWPAWTLSTHDCPRLATRVIGEQTRVAAMLLLTLQGTPIVYYGEEIGMRGVPIPPSEAIDPQGRRIGRNRDPERTPMQWNATEGAGFSTAQPWLPIGDDRATANVDSQRENPSSLLALYRRLITLRREEPGLLEGTFELLSAQPPLLSYRSSSPDGCFLVVLNMAHDELPYALPPQHSGHVLVSTFLDRKREDVRDHVQLRGCEGVVLKLKAPK